MIAKDQATLAEAETALDPRAEPVSTGRHAADGRSGRPRATRRRRRSTATAPSSPPIRCCSSTPRSGRRSTAASATSRSASAPLSAPERRSSRLPNTTRSTSSSIFRRPICANSSRRSPSARSRSPPSPQSDKGKPRDGQITFYDNTVDPASGTILAKARFENADGSRLARPVGQSGGSLQQRRNRSSWCRPSPSAPGADGFCAFVVVKDSKVQHDAGDGRTRQRRPHGHLQGPVGGRPRRRRGTGAADRRAGSDRAVQRSDGARIWLGRDQPSKAETIVAGEDQ